MRDIRAAVRLLTVVPLPGAQGERPVAYFSWVGWMFTAAAAVVVGLAAAVGLDRGIGALLAAALVVGSWALLSGMLHWDGLADTADGTGVRGDAARRLAVMRESTIGSFGVVAIVLVALLQVSALAVVIETGAWWALAAPVLGRWAAAMMLWHSTPARSDGLGARYADSGTVGAHLIAAAALVPMLVLPFPPSAARIVAVVACLAVAVVLPRPFIRTLGGFTGDVLGATVLLAETVVLLAGAIVGVAS